MRKAAISLSVATHSNLSEYLNMPRRDLLNLCEEVNEAWQEMEH